MVCSLKSNRSEIWRLLNPSATMCAISSSRLLSGRELGEPRVSMGRGSTNASSTNSSSAELAQTCPPCTQRMHLHSAWNESDRQKTPWAPHRNASTTRFRSSASSSTTMLTSRWRLRTSLTKRSPSSGSGEKPVLISTTSKAERSSARITSSGVAAATASKHLLRNNPSTMSWQLMATASATRTLVLRSELGTDAKRNQYTLNGGRTREFYPQSLPATRSHPTLGWHFLVR